MTNITDAISKPVDTIYTGADPDQYVTRSYTTYQGNQYAISNAPDGGMIWGTVDANRIRGTDGTQFAPGVNRAYLSAYVSELQREVPLQYMFDYTFKDITLRRHVLPTIFMQNASTYPNNAVYYAFGPSGSLNLTRGYYGAEIFITKPHFLDADPILLNGVNGLSPPDSDKHDTTIDVEPNSGFVMRAFKRMQINVRMYPFPTWCLFPFIEFPNITSGYWPVAWFEESGEIPDDKSHDFVSQVYGAQKLAYYFKWLGFVFGEVLVFMGVIFFLLASHRKEKELEQSKNPNLHESLTNNSLNQPYNYTSTRPSE